MELTKRVEALEKILTEANLGRKWKGLFVLLIAYLVVAVLTVVARILW
jgi:hypothetical protein